MSLEFSAQSQQRIERLLTQYPTAQAALLPVLHLAQEEFGHLSDEALHLVADTLKLPSAHVFGVITFYTMFHREPSGRNELMVCTNVSCMLRGGYTVLRHIESRLGIKAGETTPDGCFHLVEEECLAACANAPMMISGDNYYLDLTPQKVDTILDDLRRRWQQRTGQAPAPAAVGTRTMVGLGPDGKG
jgi:NADH dehydrogenase (ubiquinone) flavoprotein 2